MDEYEQYKDDSYEDDESLKDQVKPVGYLDLFKFADRIDILLMVIGLLFSLGNGISIVFYSIPFGKLVDAFSGDKTPDQIVDDALQSVYGFLINSAIVFVNSWFMSAAWMITSQRQMIRARKLYFESILKQQIAWHDKNRATEVCSKMYIQVNKVHQALVNNVTSVLTKVSMGSSGIIIALVRGWRMALVMIAFLPAMMLSGFISGYFLKKIELYNQTKKIRQDSEVIQVFDNIKTIKMLDGERYETERYEKSLKKAEEETRISGIKSAVAFAFFFFCIVMNYTLGFWYGSKLVSEKIINDNTGKIYSVSDVVVIFFTLYISNISLSGLPESLASFNVSRVSMKKILLITQRIPKVIEGISDFPEQISKIQFKNITFHYEQPLFDGFDLQLKGGVTAIIGASGCGKTTIISLIMRFYDVLQGELLFHTLSQKKNIKDFNFKSLREKIGYVGQEPVLIGKTIRQVLFENKYSERKIFQVLQIVQADNFVKEIGLDTDFTMLSGGQKQRIAIARALLKNPVILILDESTSALDGKTQQQVLGSIRKQGIQFIIMIAHRMQTLNHVDRIIKMNRGRIEAEGTYKQMQKNGYIEEMQKNQKRQQRDEKQVKMETMNQLIIEDGHYEEKQEYKVEENEENYNFQMDYLWKLIKLNNQYWYLYAAGVIGSLYFGCIFPAFSYLLSQIIALLSKISTIDDKDLPQYQAKAQSLALALLLISIGALIFTLLKGVCFAYLNERLGYFVKKNAFQKSINKEILEIQKVGSQTYSHIITINCEDLKPLGGNFLPHIIENSVTVIVGLGIAFAFSWQVTLVSLAIFPLILLSSKLQMSFNHGMQSNTDSVHQKNHQMVVNSVMHIRTVKGLGLESSLVEKYRVSLDSALKLAVKYGNIVGILFGIGQTLISCLLALIFFVGALLIRAKVVEVVDVYTAIYAVMFAGVQAGGNLFFLTKLSVAKFGTCKYFQLVRDEDHEGEQNNIIQSDSEELEDNHVLKGNIRMEEVSFKYESRDNLVFDKFNLSIKEGQKIALVGSSGSGKSTITNLLLKIYNPLNGQILYDENDIKSISSKRLKKQISIVSQEPALFNRSIFDNIKYNKSNATKENVIEASKIANAYDFIMEGNFGRKDQQKQDEGQGFNKLAGLKGSFLSGGQKQRIAIARALVRKPKILILDEATSALDVKNEKIIQEALQGMKDVTQIIIAHRLSTIKNCDRIYVLEKGRIVQDGQYKELMQKNGYFYRLVSGAQN